MQQRAKLDDLFPTRPVEAEFAALRPERGDHLTGACQRAECAVVQVAVVNAEPGRTCADRGDAAGAMRRAAGNGHMSAARLLGCASTREAWHQFLRDLEGPPCAVPCASLAPGSMASGKP